jgi:hypothetical protein
MSEVIKVHKFSHNIFSHKFLQCAQHVSAYICHFHVPEYVNTYVHFYIKGESTICVI